MHACFMYFPALFYFFLSSFDSNVCRIWFGCLGILFRICDKCLACFSIVSLSRSLFTLTLTHSLKSMCYCLLCILCIEKRKFHNQWCGTCMCNVYLISNVFFITTKHKIYQHRGAFAMAVWKWLTKQNMTFFIDCIAPLSTPPDNCKL